MLIYIIIMEININYLKSLVEPINNNSINLVENNNITYNQILIIIGSILFSIFIYNQLIKISTVLVIPTKKNKKNNCNFI